MPLENGPALPGIASSALPSTAATDALGGTTAQPLPVETTSAPLPGADALRSPAEQNLPMTPPSGGASIFQRLSAAQSPHLQRMVKSTKQALADSPQAAAQPGGWAKALVGGAIDAIGGSLGDVAAVGTVPSGGGALTGIARTLGARTQRMRQQRLDVQEENKNKILNAEANTRMIHEQQLIYNLGEEAKQTSVKSGLEQLDVWRNQPSPGVVKAQGLTADQAKKQLSEDKLDPTEETMVPSGVKVLGTDKDGRQQTQITYSVVRTTPVTLDPSNPKQKSMLDRLNEYAPVDPSNKNRRWEGDGSKPVTLNGAQFNLAVQRANDAQAAQMAAQKSAIQAGFNEQDIQRDKEALDFRTDPNITKALASATNSVTGQPDMISARNALYQASQNPQSPLYNKYSNIDNDMRTWLGYTENAKGEKTYVFDKMLEDYQNKQDTAMEGLGGIQKDLLGATGDKATSIAANLQAKITDPSTPKGMIPTYTRMLREAQQQAKASQDYEVNLATRKTQAEQAASAGDWSELQDMALKYEINPNDLFSKFKGLAEKQKFLAQMHKADPEWSESLYKARFNTANDFRPEGKGGQAVQSLNTFAGHTGDANSLISTLQNTKSPLLNMPLNKFKKEVLGQPQFVAYRTAMQAAADNYIDFLLNQKAKHASDDALVAELTSDNTSPAAAQGVLRQMANTVAIRARQLNGRYKQQMKSDIPDFLDPDTTQVLQSFGIDPDSITKEGPSGLIKTEPTLPPAAMSQLKEGQHTRFGNGQIWTLQNGKPVQIQGQ